jgi:hypothetical protein
MGRVKDTLMGLPQGIDAFYLPDNFEDWDDFTGLGSPPQCHHEFPNTGTRKSWCRHCGMEAEWSTEKGEYLLKA